MKTCSKCGIEKPLEDFYRNSQNKSTGRRPDCKGCASRRNSAWYKSAAGRKWLRTLRYGITESEYAALQEKQQGRCALCSKKPTGVRPLGVDHDHLTGKVRGLLCVPCNTALGRLGDTVLGLQRVIAYLESAA